MQRTEKPYYEDVQALWRNNGLAHFWPRASNSGARLNALVRLIAYSSLACFFVRRDVRFLVAGLVGIAALTIVFAGSPSAAAGAPPPAALSARSMRIERQDLVKDNPMVQPPSGNPYANRLIGESTPPRPNPDLSEAAAGGFVDASTTDQARWTPFYTMPNGGVPDPTAFGEFAYGELAATPSCRENTAYCNGP